MCHLRHMLKFVWYHREVMFSRVSSFCIFTHPMIYQICDVMMSLSTWERVHFWIYLLNHDSLSHQTWSIVKFKQGQYFSGMLWTIRWTGDKLQVFSNLTTCSNYFINNYVKILAFHENVNKGQLKMVNVN